MEIWEGTTSTRQTIMSGLQIKKLQKKIVEDANKYDLSWQQYKGDDLILYFYDWNNGGEEIEITYENTLEMTPEERAEVSSIDNIPEL